MTRRLSTFDAGTWLSETVSLHIEARGCLITLLMWQRHTGDPLPLRHTERMRIVGITDHRVWRRVWKSIARYFESAPDGLRALQFEDRLQSRNPTAGTALAVDQNASNLLAPGVPPVQSVQSVLSDPSEQTEVESSPDPLGDHRTPFGEDAEVSSFGDDLEPGEYRPSTEADPRGAANASTFWRWVALAHKVLTARGEQSTTVADVIEDLKMAAAQQNLERRPLDVDRRALEAAAKMRVRAHRQAGEKPVHAALRVLKAILEESGATWTAQDDVNGVVWGMVQATWPEDRLAQFRSDVLGLAWNVRTYKLEPRTFEVRPTKTPHQFEVRIRQGATQ